VPHGTPDETHAAGHAGWAGAPRNHVEQQPQPAAEAISTAAVATINSLLINPISLQNGLIPL
jgi:hypothetical protein